MRLENDELYLQVKKEKAISGYGRTKTISSLVDQTKRRFFFCDGVFTFQGLSYGRKKPTANIISSGGSRYHIYAYWKPSQPPQSAPPAQLILLASKLPTSGRRPLRESSFSELLNPHGLQVHVFVSHFWGHLCSNLASNPRVPGPPHLRFGSVGQKWVVTRRCQGGRI